MVLKEGRELPAILVLGNSHVLGSVFTGLFAVPAAVLLLHNIVNEFSTLAVHCYLSPADVQCEYNTYWQKPELVCYRTHKE